MHSATNCKQHTETILADHHEHALFSSLVGNPSTKFRSAVTSVNSCIAAYCTVYSAMLVIYESEVWNPWSLPAMHMRHDD